MLATGRVLRVVGSVFSNPPLRRVELAFAAFNAGEWGVWIALLVFAYAHGGATTAGLVALAQLLPAGIFAPLAATLGDRYRPARVLTVGYAAQGVALAATAVAATAVTITRPAQAALLPALARTPDELTATNVVSGWIESVSVLAPPAAAGLLLAWSGPGAVFAVMAVLVLGGAALVAGIRGPEPAAPSASHTGVLDETVDGLRLLAREPGSRLLVAVLGAQYLVIGALDVLFVVLAVSVLGLGGSGAGYLNAAFGAGGVVGIAATVALVGRPRLVPPLLLGIVVWSLAFVVLGLRPSAVAAFVMLGVAGAGRTLLDVAGRTLLQRVAPGDLLARTFGALEGISMFSLALGSMLAPLLVAVAGARAAIACAGAILPLIAAACVVRLRAIDERAMVPVVEIALLRSLPLFAPLGAPALESLARSLKPVTMRAGDEIVRAGDPGDRYYAVADGEFAVSVGGVLRRGDGFGELALLRDIPRTATVTAVTDGRLYALAKGDFLAAVTGHSDSAAVAARLVRERLPG